MMRMSGRKAVVGVFFLYICLFVNAATAFSSEKGLFMWKVQSETNTAFLLGSIHVLKKDFYPLDRNIEKAFDTSDVLAVEANIGENSRMDLNKVIDAGFYKGEDSLSNHVSAETYRLVMEEFDKFLPAQLLSRQKPWMLSVTIPSIALGKLGFDPNYGIDMHFLRKAEGKKRIEELESVDYQLNLFSGFSEKEQEALLLYTMRDMKMLEREVDSIVEAWRKGDAEGLESILTKNIDDRDMVQVYEKLVYARNASMASKIEGFLKSKERYFIVVGAGHLVGPRGIVRILKRQGYSVEQVAPASGQITAYMRQILHEGVVPGFQ